MKDKTFLKIAGIIFALVALLHLSRIYMQWPVTIGSWAFPMWLSWAGFVAGGVLSYFALRFAARSSL